MWNLFVRRPTLEALTCSRCSFVTYVSKQDSGSVLSCPRCQAPLGEIEVDMGSESSSSQSGVMPAGGRHQSGGHAGEAHGSPGHQYPLVALKMTSAQVAQAAQRAKGQGQRDVSRMGSPTDFASFLPESTAREHQACLVMEVAGLPLVAIAAPLKDQTVLAVREALRMDFYLVVAPSWSIQATQKVAYRRDQRPAQHPSD